MIYFRLLILFCGVFLLSAPLVAAEKKTISQQLFKKLQQSEQLIANKAYGEARKTMQSALSGAADDYEKATALRSLASIYALQEQYKKAAQMLSQSLTLKAFEAEQQQQILYDLGQLYMATEQYQKAINIMQPWLAANTAPNAEVYALMANAHTQLKHYRQALPYIKKAIQAAKKPQESWYQLNLALYYELHEYAPASRLLQKLIQLYPDKKQYWNQLISVYQQLKQFKKAASLNNLAYKKGLLNTEKEILDLVNLFRYIDSPYRAGSLLNQELNQQRVKNTAKNQELLANVWTQAREFDFAIKALQQASKLSDKGRLYQQLGQIFVEQEKWRKASEALNKALKKGGLKQIGNTYLLLGMSYFEADQTAKAKSAFAHAAKYKKTKSAAVQWLDYIKSQGVAS